MVELRDTHECQNANDLGITIRLEGPTTGPATYRDAGESVAASNSTRSAHVWVFVYAHDMDMEGPAICVSYVGPDSTGPATEFLEYKTLLTYYSLKAKQQASLRGAVVPVGEGD